MGARVYESNRNENENGNEYRNENENGVAGCCLLVVGMGDKFVHRENTFSTVDD